MDKQVDRMALVADFSERLINEYGSSVREVGEEALFVINAVANLSEAEVAIDGELYNFLTSEYDLTEPIWEFVVVLDD
jgi:hypothetical protein